jgi:PAS domain S-box-containing protein
MFSIGMVSRMAEKIMHINFSNPFKNILIKSIFLTIIMSALIGYSYNSSVIHIRNENQKLALAEAISNWNKDSSFRQWATLHGGVYVKPNERTPRSPALAHLSNRDVITTGGMELTLMNPAYMLRQMSEEFEVLYGIKGKITGKKLLNPINKADEWQLKALDLFESGKTNELVEQQIIDGLPYLRYMKAMYMTEGCVKCHGILGYKDGDLRGGVSISIPLTPYLTSAEMTIKKIRTTHVFVWLIGFIVTVFFIILRRKYLSRLNKSIEILRSSEEKFRKLFESSADGMLIVDSNGNIEMINQQIQEMTFYSIDEIKGLPVETLIPQRFKEHAQVRNNFINNPKTRMMGESKELFVQRKDASEFIAEISLSPLNTVDGLIVLTSIRDITQRTKATEELNKQAMIIDQIHDSVISTDIDGFITIWNIGAEKLFGYTKDETIGNHISMIDPEKRYKFLHDKIIAPLMTKGELETEIKLQHKSGESFHAHLSLSMLYDNLGHTTGMIGYSMDISERKRAEDLKRESEVRLRNMLDSMFTFVGLIDFDGILIDTNKAPLERASLSPDEVIGKLFSETYWWSYSKEVQDKLNSAIQQAKEGTVTRYDEIVRMGKSDYISIDVCFGPLYDSEGNIIKIIASAADITDRVKIETKLKESEEHFEFATIGSNDGLWDWNVETNVEWWSTRFYQLLGYKQNEIDPTYNNFVSFIHPEDKNDVYIAIDNHLNLDKKYDINFRMKTKSGVYRWFNSRAQVIRDANNKPNRMAGIIRDITENIAQEETITNKTKELEHSKNHLRQLSAKIERIREEERTAIAREVHDELGQAFTALTFDVSWLKRSIRTSKTEIKDKLDSMLDIISKNTDRVRKISSELRPPVLDDLGLNAAIEWYCFDMKQKLGLEYEHNLDIEEEYISFELKTALFRIFQEAMTNIVRHSKADIYWVNLKYFKGRLIMQIIDNGIGIDEVKITKSASLGILGMTERIQAYGGTVSVKNHDKHRGTEVYIYVPLIETRH